MGHRNQDRIIMGHKLYIEDIAINPVVKVLLDTDPVPLGDTGDSYIDSSQDLLAWKARFCYRNLC